MLEMRARATSVEFTPREGSQLYVFLGAWSPIVVKADGCDCGESLKERHVATPIDAPKSFNGAPEPQRPFCTSTDRGSLIVAGCLTDGRLWALLVARSSGRWYEKPIARSGRGSRAIRRRCRKAEEGKRRASAPARTGAKALSRLGACQYRGLGSQSPLSNGCPISDRGDRAFLPCRRAPSVVHRTSTRICV
jgi:hypothetical protein